MTSRHHERHRLGNAGWLRAAVLGANDGIISTASLLLGVAAAHSPHSSIVTAGLAGLVAGAMSMAAGEYVSVHSQADSEQADLNREKAELNKNRQAETRELTDIYIERGLEADLAREVARQLMAHDALAAHARDELGLSDNTAARPIQAAMASAASFTAGAAMPLLVAVLVQGPKLIPFLVAASLTFLAFLGGVAAYMGGASISSGVWRVTFWGALAMAVTAGIGALFGTVT